MNTRSKPATLAMPLAIRAARGRSVVFGPLPKTSTGKVRKTELRARGLTCGTWDRVAAGLVVRTHEAGTPPKG